MKTKNDKIKECESEINSYGRELSNIEYVFFKEEPSPYLISLYLKKLEIITNKITKQYYELNKESIKKISKNTKFLTPTVTISGITIALPFFSYFYNYTLGNKCRNSLQYMVINNCNKN